MLKAVSADKVPILLRGKALCLFLNYAPSLDALRDVS